MPSWLRNVPVAVISACTEAAPPSTVEVKFSEAKKAEPKKAEAGKEKPEKA